MNHVERFRALMNFEPVDRLLRIEWAGWWDKTIERWGAQGLPAELNDRSDKRGSGLLKVPGGEEYFMVLTVQEGDGPEVKRARAWSPRSPSTP